ncbi:MAG: GAF domain-containing protein [Gammaproteobacteria bacterium]
MSGIASAQGMRRSDISLVGVYEISKLLTAPARLEATLGGVLQLLSSFLDMRHGLIALLDEHGAPEVVVGSGWSESTAKHYFERLPERAIGRIVVTRMPLVIEDMKSDALFENWSFAEWGAAEGDFSFIGVPIKDRGAVVGTLTIDREHGEVPGFSLDEDVRFLTMIANLIGQTVRVQRLISRDREWLMTEQRRLEKTLEHAASERIRFKRAASSARHRPFGPCWRKSAAWPGAIPPCCYGASRAPARKCSRSPCTRCPRGAKGRSWP